MGPGNLEEKSEAPSVPDIVDEAQRRVRERMQQEVPPNQRALVNKLYDLVFWLSKHWLAVFNALAAFYVGGAILPPVFIKIGWRGAAGILYTFYKPLCHQYPFRSWFLFGPKLAYPLTQPIEIEEMAELRTFIGTEDIGYKMALCQRDIAIYGLILLAGLTYALLRRHKHFQALPMWGYFIFGVLPMMLDGGVQWISYVAWRFLPGLVPAPFETIPIMRALTGALFGFGIVAAIYPLMNEYFEDVHQTLKKKRISTT